MQQLSALERRAARKRAAEAAGDAERAAGSSPGRMEAAAATSEAAVRAAEAQERLRRAHAAASEAERAAAMDVDAEADVEAARAVPPKMARSSYRDLNIPRHSRERPSAMQIPTTMQLLCEWSKTWTCQLPSPTVRSCEFNHSHQFL